MRPGFELLEALPVAVYATDAEGRITFFNQAAVDLWGYRPQPAVAMTVPVHADVLARWSAAAARSMSNGAHAEGRPTGPRLRGRR